MKLTARFRNYQKKQKKIRGYVFLITQERASWLYKENDMDNFILEEQETTINIMRTDDFADIYTCDSTVMTKLNKRVKSNPDEWTIIEETKNDSGRVIARRYRCPKRLVSFRVKTLTRNK